MDKKTNNGLGLGTTLFLIFLVLKLVGVEPIASWSWWWVTSPLWAVFAFLICFWLLVGVLVVIPFTVSVMILTMSKIIKKKPLK